jgi:hypothetical protein
MFCALADTRSRVTFMGTLTELERYQGVTPHKLTDINNKKKRLFLLLIAHILPTALP